jgi:rSAM/selenodomain-associated transferase 2
MPNMTFRVTSAPLISVIIPTFNEARALDATLVMLAALPDLMEVIIVDGGSLDATTAIARAHGVRLLFADRGRGIQLHAGAQVARGDILWFVHADVHPPTDAARLIREALARPTVSGGCFTVRFDNDSRQARFLTWFYARLQGLGLCYGDATLFIRRCDYEQCRGFRPFPLFEDLDLVDRLRQRGRFVRLPAEVTVSCRRFDGRSLLLTLLWWMVLQLLYWLGVPPRYLGRLYAPIRARPRRTKRLTTCPENESSLPGIAATSCRSVLTNKHRHDSEPTRAISRQ